jgi:hypothetical protein
MSKAKDEIMNFDLSFEGDIQKNYLYIPVEKYNLEDMILLCYRFLLQIEIEYGIPLPLPIDMATSYFLPELIQNRVSLIYNILPPSDMKEHIFVEYWYNFANRNNSLMMNILHDVYLYTTYPKKIRMNENTTVEILKDFYFPFLCKLLGILRYVIPPDYDYSMISTIPSETSYKTLGGSSRMWNTLGYNFSTNQVTLNQFKKIQHTEEKSKIYQMRDQPLQEKLKNLRDYFFYNIINPSSKEHKKSVEAFNTIMNYEMFKNFYKYFIQNTDNEESEGLKKRNIYRLNKLINDLYNSQYYDERYEIVFKYLYEKNASIYRYPDGTLYMSSVSYKNYNNKSKKSKSMIISFIGFLYSLHYYAFVEWQLKPIINKEKGEFKEMRNEIKRYKNSIAPMNDKTQKRRFLKEDNILRLINGIAENNKYAKQKREHLNKILSKIPKFIGNKKPKFIGPKKPKMDKPVKPKMDRPVGPKRIAYKKGTRPKKEDNQIITIGKIDKQKGKKQKKEKVKEEKAKKAKKNKVKGNNSSNNNTNVQYSNNSSNNNSKGKKSAPKSSVIKKNISGNSNGNTNALYNSNSSVSNSSVSKKPNSEKKSINKNLSTSVQKSVMKNIGNGISA